MRHDKEDLHMTIPTFEQLIQDKPYLVKFQIVITQNQM